MNSISKKDKMDHKNTQLAEFSVKESWQTNRSAPVAWLLSYMRHYWYLVLIMLIGAVGNGGLAALVPVLVGRAFNAIVASPPQISALLPIALWIAGSQIVRGVVLQFARNFGAELIGQHVERDIRHELYISLLGKSMTFHSMQSIGETMARATNDVREVNFLFSPGVNLVIGSANFMIMPLILAPTYHPALILVPLLYIVGYVLALIQYLRELSPITSDVRRSFGILNSRLSEAIDGIETVKGMSQERNEIERFFKNAADYRDAFVKQGDIEARFIPLLLLGFAEAGALLHGFLLYQGGAVDIGQVVAYFGLIQLFGFPTFVSLFAYSQISLGIASAQRILDLINQESDLDQNKTGYSAAMYGEIEFQNVSFEYQEGETSLEGLTFHIKPGQTVAIVGQTGSGKTTLAKLINRTYDATRGNVLVDGVNVKDWKLEDLRKNISIIEQDIFLFSRSIADNIAFGFPDATREQVQEYARAAQAHEFILTFNEAYDTVIGERGVTLSGGQRQRLALARAFLTDPRILILDDSTSAIDSATEDKIQRAIFEAAKGRTTLIITHRLSQIRWADMIIVMRQGKIAAIGDHDKLMETSQAYRRIFSE
jgi:ATP-binding cassette, subfamily B, bacterial